METAVDTLIKDGLVITPAGRTRMSVGIRDGVIAGLFEPGLGARRSRGDRRTRACRAARRNRHALAPPPGIAPGFEYKDTIHTATMQCAAGGVTTSIGMPNVNPPPNTIELLEKQFALYRSDAMVDWNFNPAPTDLKEIPAMAKTGIAAFKIFMVVDTGRSYPHMPGIGVHDHGKLLEIMQACAEMDLPLMVHPHDQALMDAIERKFWARGERDALAYAKAYAAHDGVIWETAIGTLLRLQKAAGCHLHILHTQTAGSVDSSARQRRRDSG